MFDSNEKKSLGVIKTFFSKIKTSNPFLGVLMLSSYIITDQENLT